MECFISNLEYSITGADDPAFYLPHLLPSFFDLRRTRSGLFSLNIENLVFKFPSASTLCQCVVRRSADRPP